MEWVVGGKFRVGRKTGFGTFGETYVGTNVQSGAEVAIKLESVNAKHPRLLYETKVHNILAGAIGVPNIHWYGVEGDYNVVVMDLLGPSLEDLFNFCSHNFSLKTVLMLAEQMISLLEYLHSKSFIHRHVRPEVFFIGRGRRKNQVYLTDFADCKPYQDTKTAQHIPHRKGKAFLGATHYASVNAHIGIEQSRRDDLEALGYVLLYFKRGILPWQGIKATSSKDKEDKVMMKKMSTSVDDLCTDLPSEFAMYMNYCRKLPFMRRPDYAYLRCLFRSLASSHNYLSRIDYDYMFDWSFFAPEQLASVSAPDNEDNSDEGDSTAIRTVRLGTSEVLGSSGRKFSGLTYR